MPYVNIGEFVAALCDFEVTYSYTHKDPDESDEAAIMRLAARLKDNPSMLQVTTSPMLSLCFALKHSSS